MTAFYWSWPLYKLLSGHTIDDVYNNLAGNPSVFTTKTASFDGTTVHALSPPFRVSVLCLMQTSPYFYLIVAVSGDGSGSDAETLRNEVLGNIGLLASHGTIFLEV